jgi:hypothetical protein
LCKFLPVTKQNAYAGKVLDLLNRTRSSFITSAVVAADDGPLLSVPRPSVQPVQEEITAPAFFDDSAVKQAVQLAAQLAVEPAAQLALKTAQRVEVPPCPSQFSVPVGDSGVGAELARLQSQWSTDPTDSCSACTRMFPPWLAERAKVIHKKALGDKMTGSSFPSCSFEIVQNTLDKTTCPRTGRSLRPTFPETIFKGRRLLIFDTRLHDEQLVVPVSLLATAPPASSVLMCPCQTPGQPPHHVARVGMVPRHFIDSGSFPEPALVAQNKCIDCKHKFLETDQALLLRYPLSLIQQWGLDGDSNTGDPAILLSQSFVDDARYVSLHRGGAGNVAASVHESCGAAAARRSLVMCERAQRWFGYLLQNVSDDKWQKMSPAEKILNASIRAELIFGENFKFSPLPSNCHVALSSPPISADRINGALIASNSARLSFTTSELQSQQFQPGLNVISLDHSKTPAANFTGPCCAWSLTVYVNGMIWHFELVETTDKGPVLRVLCFLGSKPKPHGCRVLLTLDNVAHSGDTELLAQYRTACGAEAVVQDLYHVVNQMGAGIDNTDEYFTTGTVRALPPVAHA